MSEGIDASYLLLVSGDTAGCGSAVIGFLVTPQFRRSVVSSDQHSEQLAAMKLRV